MRAALAAVDPGRLVRAVIAAPDAVRPIGNAAAIDVVAVGKAGEPMLRACIEALQQAPLRHVIGISNRVATSLPSGVKWHVTAHPIPDGRSVSAARMVVDVAAAATTDDLLLVLVSGGASAMMALPADGISLEDKRRTSELLLHRGAEIHVLNGVRKHLSAIKGGRLAGAARGSVLTLAVSDVVGDELSAIGSGPTVGDSTTFADALAALERYGGTSRYPKSVVRRLVEGVRGGIEETPKPGDAALARSTAHVIGGARTAVNGARAAAGQLGYTVHVIDEPVTGEARAAGPRLVETALRQRILDASAPLCILAAGETTVRVTGSGSGGRNQECALAMVRALDALGETVVGASVGTDGVDGPTDAAGALVDTTTLSRAMAARLAPPERYLDDNDSYTFFDRLGDLIRTGPTNTNVGDLQVILIGQ